MKIHPRALSLAFLTLSSFVLPAAQASAHASDGHPVTLHQWPNSVTGSTRDEGGFQLPTSIFDHMDSVRLFDRPLRSGTDLSAKVQREVFENHDLLDTWTVVDHFRFQAAQPILGWDGALSGTPAYFSLGLSAAVQSEWIDVRQVAARKYVNLPEVSERRGEIFSNGITELQVDNPFYLFDASLRPRFGKLWNFFTFPFRLPTSSRPDNRMQVGELISYSAQGSVELSGNIGLNILPVPGVSLLQADLGVRTYVEGTYRITVLKEDDRYMKVKLSRQILAGEGADFSTSGERQTPLKGVFLVGKYSPSIVPFEFAVDRTEARLFDVGYRYDMHEAAGREAFKQAVIGLFAQSEESLGSGVEQILERKGTQLQTSASKKVKLILFKRAHQRTEDALDVTVELPDGTHHLFRAQFQTSKEWRFMLKAHEREEYDFSTAFDQEAYDAKKANSLMLICETLIENSNASRTQMDRYIRDAEAVTGQTGVIPHIQELNAPDGQKKLGRTSFYYGLNINRPLLEKFATVSDERKAQILDSLFRSRHLKNRFFNQWSEVQDAEDPKEMAKLLAKFLSTPRHGREMVLLLRLALEGDDIDYFITATNPSFGEIQRFGQATSDADAVLRAVTSRLGYEQVVQGHPGYRGDPSAQIRLLQASSLDHGRVLIEFVLDEEPAGLFFRVNRTSGWKHFRREEEVLFDNFMKRFHKGKNQLILDKNSPDDLLSQKLAQKLMPGEFYSLSLGYTRDKSQWGLAETIRFQAP